MAQFQLEVEAGKPASFLWADLWRYRELFYFLAWREIMVRYKQTVIGVAWTIIRPLVAMAAFTVAFGKLARLPSDGVPYAVMVYTGMLPWFFFSSSLQESGNSLLDNANMVSKVYFPRVIFPVSTIILNLLEFAISFVILLIVMGTCRFLPGLRIMLLPVFLVHLILMSLGCGFWLCALNVKYRDFRYAVPFLVQFAMYISPVGFSSSVIPEDWRLLYCLNPLTGIIDAFRWAIIGGNTALYWPGFLFSAGFTLVVLMSGIWYFHRVERTLADVI